VPHQQKNQAEKADLSRRCYDLRLQGFTVRQVAEKLGCSPATVSRHCRAEAEAVVKPLAAEFRQYQDEQLDAMYQAMLPKAAAGSPRHAEMAIRILERRAKLLGLDAPVQVQQDVTVQNETDRKLAELTRELLAQESPELAERFDA
jgi:AcrR family transcriptional regulator